MISIITFSSCNEAEKLLTFNIKTEADIVIPSTIGINTPLSIPTPDISTNSQQEFSNNDTKKELVKDVKLTTLSLQIIKPANETFGFLKKITIFIKAEGLPEKKLAYLDPVPDNTGNTIQLKPTNEKLDEYVKADAFSIRTEAVTDKGVFQDIEIKAKMNFKVTADIL